jgi:uncharacterized protein YjbI with pentapeptide repeats
MKQVSFQDSNFTYSNFEHSKLQGLTMKASDFSNTCLAECTLKNLELEEALLKRCDFFKTSLKGIDFRNSNIEGITVSDTLVELRGAVVDPFQAAELSRFLGIVIK